MPRKRKKAPRTKSGRLSRAYQTIAKDEGTPEVQAKRQAAVGTGDPVLAASALGYLLAYEHIDREQYDEALRYRALWTAKFGTLGLCNSYGPTASDERLAKLEIKLAELERRMTVEEREELVWVACGDRIPVWFDAKRLGLKILPEDERDRELLMRALDALLDRRHGSAHGKAA